MPVCIYRFTDDLANKLNPKFYTITGCAYTVRIQDNRIDEKHKVYIQKTVEEPNSLWKLFIGGNYIIGMVDIYDCFIFAKFYLNLTR